MQGLRYLIHMYAYAYIWPADSCMHMAGHTYRLVHAEERIVQGLWLLIATGALLMVHAWSVSYIFSLYSICSPTAVNACLGSGLGQVMGAQ